jgi:SAM-dependent methyltransferase
VEGYEPATYGDGMASVYDDWYATRGDVEGAVACLVSLAGTSPVLELGIGSGRLALPLAAAGVDVWGVDASAAMVERLRSKPGGDRLPVAIGDMAELDLTGLPDGETIRFSVVYAADNTFFNLTTADAQRCCLEQARSLLAPNGRIAIEAFVPDPDAAASSVEARTVAVDHVVLTVTRHDREAQTVAGQHIELREAGIRLHPWMVRYATPAELDAMAASVGLQLSERWSNWRGAPFTDQDNTHVSVYVARA